MTSASHVESTVDLSDTVIDRLRVRGRCNVPLLTISQSSRLVWFSHQLSQLSPALHRNSQSNRCTIHAIYTMKVFCSHVVVRGNGCKGTGWELVLVLQRASEGQDGQRHFT